MKKAKNGIEVMARGVYVRSGRLLVCHTRGADNTYLPGGHVEWGESAPEALVREIREELGVKARAASFLGVVEHRYRQKGRWHFEINLVWLMRMTLDSAVAPPSCEGHLDFRWIPLAQLGRSDLEPAPLRRWISNGLRGRAGGAVRWASTLPR